MTILSTVPTWGWVAGGVTVAGVSFLYYRGRKMQENNASLIDSGVGVSTDLGVGGPAGIAYTGAYGGAPGAGDWSDAAGPTGNNGANSLADMTALLAATQNAQIQAQLQTDLARIASTERISGQAIASGELVQRGQQLTTLGIVSIPSGGIGQRVCDEAGCTQLTGLTVNALGPGFSLSSTSVNTPPPPKPLQESTAINDLLSRLSTGNKIIPVSPAASPPTQPSYSDYLAYSNAWGYQHNQLRDPYSGWLAAGAPGMPRAGIPRNSECETRRLEARSRGDFSVSCPV